MMESLEVGQNPSSANHEILYVLHRGNQADTHSLEDLDLDFSARHKRSSRHFLKFP
jgi:hypothetical protein